MKKIVVFGLIFAVGVGATYYVVKRFQHDRLSAMNYRSYDPRQTTQGQTTTSDGKTTKTYTAEELADLKKKGQLPKDMQSTNAAQAAATNEAAVQRQLKTIE